ncbi:MAG: EAL domain-containing protein [Pseudomonadota bacterium]|nr:EAL domain-containing protein [Pseudomonadota bacterium]
MSILKGIRSLIVEDDPELAGLLEIIIEDLDLVHIGTAATEDEAYFLAIEHKPELIFMDMHLKNNGSGAEVSKAILEQINTAIMFITGYDDSASITKAMEVTPYAYIIKPYKPIDIQIAAHTAIARFNLEKKLITSEKRYEATANVLQLVSLTYEPLQQSIHIKASSELSARFGFQETMSFESFAQIFVDDVSSAVFDRISKGDSVKTLLRARYLDSLSPAWLYVHFLPSSPENPNQYVGAAIDKTDEVHSLESIETSSLIIEQMREGVVILDKQHNILKANSAFTKAIGFSLSEITHSGIQDFFAISRKDDLDLYLKQELTNVEVNLISAEGKLIPYLMTLRQFSPVTSNVGFIMTLSDVSEVRQRDHYIQELAYTDQLTKCGNRHLFNKTFSELKNSGTLFSVIFCDVNKLKYINDTYGHGCGDLIIQEVGQRLLSNLRSEDMVFRMGGDEFVMIVTETLSDTCIIANALLSVMKAPLTLPEHTLDITVSIGLASTEASGYDDVLKHADIAMYNAKEQGGNTLLCYSSKLYNKVTHRLFKEQALKNALKSNAIEAFFQPIISNNGTIIAIEALCRWRSNDAGYILPSEFIELAEETNVIHELGFTMLQESCRALQALINQGFYNIKVHLNISIIQLQNDILPSKFESIIHSYGLKPSSFVLEVTESTLHDSSTRSMLAQLKDLGFVLSIDDFGVGYTSIYELTCNDYDQIKIDKSLLPARMSEQKKKTVLINIFNLCRDLNKTIVLEGVESKEQMNFAQQKDVEFQQGFLFSEPLPFKELVNFIKEKQGQNILLV